MPLAISLMYLLAPRETLARRLRWFEIYFYFFEKKLHKKESLIINSASLAENFTCRDLLTTRAFELIHPSSRKNDFQVVSIITKA